MKDSHGEELLSVSDLDGLLTLVQAGVLEIHVWGSTIADVEHCDRIVFDLDPGDDVPWSAVNAAARELRERLADLKLKSLVKTTGGKGLHVDAAGRRRAMGPDEGFRARDGARDGGGLAGQVRVEDDQEYPRRKDLPRLSAQRARRDRDRRLFDARAAGRRGLDAGRPGTSSGRSSRRTSSRCSTSPSASAKLKRDPWADIAKVKQKLPDFGKRK